MEYAAADVVATLAIRYGSTVQWEINAYCLSCRIYKNEKKR